MIQSKHPKLDGEVKAIIRAFADEVEREVIGSDSEFVPHKEDDSNFVVNQVRRDSIENTLKYRQRQSLKDTLNKWISEED